MDKPKKKKIPQDYTKPNMQETDYCYGHNNLHDEFTNYFKHLLSEIPGEDEIKNSPSPKHAMAYYQGKFDILMDLIGGEK